MKKLLIRMAAATVVIAAAFCSSFTGADARAAASGEISNEGDRAETLRVVDRAIHRLSPPASDYRAVLSDALQDLRADHDGVVAAHAMRTFLAQAPQPGAEFRCSLDFIADRARNMLMRLGDTLRSVYVGRLEPMVCSTTPYVLDLAYARTTGAMLDIYGYDFDLVNPEMILVTKSGDYRDVTASLVRRSPNHLAFKLGDHLPWSADVVSLGLTWGHLIHHSIAVAQPTSTLCPSRMETLTERTISLRGSQGAVDTVLNFSSNKLEATVCSLGGCSTEFLHTTDPDWIIEGVLGSAPPDVSYEHHGTSVEIRLKDITYLASADQACVSPMAYIEARRTGAIDAVTQRSLDRQIKTIPPAALTMRPRFVLIDDAK